MYSQKRLQRHQSNVISTSQIGTVKNRLKQINKEHNYYTTGLFQYYGPQTRDKLS